MRFISHRPAIARAAAAAALALIPLAPAWAQGFSTTQFVNLASSGTPTQQTYEARQNAAGEVRTLSLDDAVTVPALDFSATSTGFSQASSGYGWVKTFTQGSATMTTGSASRTVQSQSGSAATMDDAFTITCPTCIAGTVGTLAASVFATPLRALDGVATRGDHFESLGFLAGFTLSATGFPVGQEESAWGYIWGYQSNSNAGRTEDGEMAGEALGSFEVNFIFGEPLWLSLYLDTGQTSSLTSTADGGEGWSTANVDFSLSLSWKGISGLWDANGQPVTDFTALNAQGVDYALAAAVPEPGTWALMALGLALLAAFARHARKSHGAVSVDIKEPAMPKLSTWRVPAAVTAIVGALFAPLANAAQYRAAQDYVTRVPGQPDRGAVQDVAILPGLMLSYGQGNSYRDGDQFANAFSVGWSGADHGRLWAGMTADAEISVHAPLQAAEVRSTVSSSLSDDIVIQCATCAAGTLGWMNFRINYEGITSRSGQLGQPPGELGRYTADTSWGANVSLQSEGVPRPPPDPPWQYTPDTVGIQYFRLETETNGSWSVYEPPHATSGLQELSIQFAFGRPIHLDLRLYASTITAVLSDESSAPFTARSRSTIDVTSTGLYWDGITGVTDADGGVVNAYTAFGTDGVDYRQSFLRVAAVPEPGTWALMLAGLLLLGARLTQGRVGMRR